MTEPIQKNTVDASKIFIANLIEVTRKDDKSLKKFIDHFLFPQKSELSIEDISNNINFIKEMDSTQRELVKSRARVFEEFTDPSKFFPALLALYGLVLSVYTILREITENSLGVVFLSIIATVILALFSARLLMLTVRLRSSAIYFNTLINSIEFKKGDIHRSDK